MRITQIRSYLLQNEPIVYRLIQSFSISPPSELTSFDFEYGMKILQRTANHLNEEFPEKFSTSLTEFVLGEWDVLIPLAIHWVIQEDVNRSQIKVVKQIIYDSLQRLFHFLDISENIKMLDRRKVVAYRTLLHLVYSLRE